MAGKFTQSWQLVKASAGVLATDRKLLLFPLLSGLCTLLVAATFLLPLGLSVGLLGGASGPDEGQSLTGAAYVALFLFYLVQYAVIFFFNTALVGAAMICLDGGRPTLGDGLRLAWSKWPQILGYAAIAATAGLLLRMLQERFGLLGRWVIGLLGVTWAVATFLVVPVLASSDVGPLDAVKRSAELLKRSWGENVIGNVGLGLVGGLIGFLLALLLGGAFLLAVSAQSVALMVTVGALAVFAFVGLALVQSALQGVYAAALYRYAERGSAGSGFEAAFLEQAFRPKGA